MRYHFEDIIGAGPALQSAIARCLGISRVTLWRWLRAEAETGADDAAE